MKNSLKRLRKEHGLTCKLLAELSGVGLSTINNYENGEREASDEVLQKVADVLKVSVSDIRSEPSVFRELSDLFEEVGFNHLSTGLIENTLIEHANALPKLNGEARAKALSEIQKNVTELRRRTAAEEK